MKRSIWLLLPLLLAVGAWQHFCHTPTPAAVAALPSCELLDHSTVAASLQPPASLAEFDALLVTMESKARAHPVMPRFRHEAATRRLQRFQALRQLSDLAAAEQHNAILLQQHPADRLALARQAALKISRHDFRSALGLAQQAGSPLLQHDALEELGEFEQANAMLADLSANGLAWHVRQARLADNQGDSDTASQQLQLAIDDARRASTHPLLMAGLLAQQATLALHNGHYQQACDGYTEVLKYNPQHVASLAWLGRWAWYAEKQDLARAFLQRALALDSFSVEIPLLLAQMQPQATQRDQLMQLARERATQWPQWHRLRTARELADQGQAAPALELLAEEARQRQGREYLAAALQINTQLTQLPTAAAALEQLRQQGVLHPPLAMLAWEFWQAQGQADKAAAYADTLRQGRVELSPDQWQRFSQS